MRSDEEPLGRLELCRGGAGVSRRYALEAMLVLGKGSEVWTQRKRGGDTVCGQGDRRAWVPGDGDCKESRDWELQRWRRLKPGGLP